MKKNLNYRQKITKKELMMIISVKIKNKKSFFLSAHYDMFLSSCS